MKLSVSHLIELVWMAFGLGVLLEDSNLIFMKTLKLYDIGEMAMDLIKLSHQITVLTPGK